VKAARKTSVDVNAGYKTYKFYKSNMKNIIDILPVCFIFTGENRIASNSARSQTVKK